MNDALIKDDAEDKAEHDAEYQASSVRYEVDGADGTDRVFAYPLSVPSLLLRKRAVRSLHSRKGTLTLAENGAIFLDKDGTILNDIPYNVQPRRMRLAPRAALALSELACARVPVYVVSNQSGVARGMFPLIAVHTVTRHLAKIFSRYGLSAAAMHFCPFHPDGTIHRYKVDSMRRKPSPGMLFDISERDGIALGASWFIGDILDDVEAGNRAGCRTILINNGNETVWKSGPFRRPDATVRNLWQAVRVIARAGRTPGMLRRASAVSEIAAHAWHQESHHAS